MANTKVKRKNKAIGGKIIMKLIEILNANEALKKLANSKFNSFKKAYELSKLRKQVDEEVNFYIEEEKKIVEAYASKDENGTPIFLDGGRIKLDSVEAKNNFEKDINELRNLEIDKISKVSISPSDFKEDIPTPNEILALEVLIDFKEVGNE